MEKPPRDLPTERGKESIRSCAMMFGDHVIEAGNHGMAYEEGLELFPDERNILDGYTTSTGRFVTREEGHRIMDGKDSIDEF